MPHAWVEYSSNLKNKLNVKQLLQTTHEAFIGDGSIFPLAGARTRGTCIEDYVIADDHPDNSFVHVLLKIGSGRTLEQKQEMGERVFNALKKLLEPISSTQAFALSLQIEEMEPDLNYKSNNYRTYIATRQAK